MDALVYATALNLARNRLCWRKLREWVGYEALQTQDARSRDPDENLQHARLHEALRQLPFDSMQILLLTEFTDMGTRGIASMLAIPAGAVASRKHSAITRLRVLLGEDR